MSIFDNLISYWKLNNNSNDAKGSNNGSDTAITYSTGNGKINEGAGLNGSTSVISVTDASSLKPINITVSLWAKWTTGNALIDRTNAFSADGYRIFLDSNKIRVAVYNGSFIELLGGTTLSTSTWYHLAMTYDGTTLTAYVNGVSDGTSVTSGSISYSGTTNLGIGNRTTGSSSPTAGAVDEIGIWSTALTSDEIYLLYNSGSGRSYPSGPIISTQAVTSIGITTATGNGTVVDDGGSVVTERGVVWGTSSNPTTSNSKSAVSGTTGVFTAPITVLTAGTFYHVRAYATNSVGTSYGDDVTFSSLSVVSTTIYKDISAAEGSTYAVSVDVGGSVGSVTVSLGSTGASQVINAGAGVTVFQGTYGGLNGLTFVKSATFNGYIDSVMWVLIVGTATINWTLDTLTNVFPINSSVVFKRLEDKQFDKFRVYRYLDIQFKDLDAYVTVLLKKEANESSSDSSKQFLVDNVSGQVLPFINKRISMLTKNYGMRIGLSNNRLNETFTVCQFVISGIEQPKKLFSGSKIISI